jgi:hypothetical protein
MPMLRSDVAAHRFSGFIMASSNQQTTNAAHKSPTHAEEREAIEAIVPMMPLVLPLVGGVLMFLLAFIAIAMA